MRAATGAGTDWAPDVVHGKLGVSEAHLRFIGLTNPEAGAWRLVDDGRRHAQLTRQLTHLDSSPGDRSAGDRRLRRHTS